MQFTAVALLAAASSLVAAAPSERRNGGSSQCCYSGGNWYWGWTGCEQSGEYNCATTGVANVLNCVNVLNGNTVDVNVGDILNGILKRNEGSQCCYSGGSWYWGWTGCEQSGEYNCATTGVANVLNCVNVLNGNSVDVNVGDILNGILKRNSGSQCCYSGGNWYWGWTGCSQSGEYNCATTGVLNVLNCVNVLNGNSVDVNVGDILNGILKRNGGGSQCCYSGGNWYWGWTGCSQSGEYNCQTTGILNVLNCVNVLNGNTVDVDISDILNGILKKRNGGSQCCYTGGNWYWGWTGCSQSGEYNCQTTGVLNILNCVNVLNGNSVKVDISDILNGVL